MVSYLGHIVTKKGSNVQFVQIVTTKSQSVKSEVALLTRKTVCKQYPIELWSTISREQWMEVRKMIWEAKHQAHHETD